jgi:hypothetical protein
MKLQLQLTRRNEMNYRELINKHQKQLGLQAQIDAVATSVFRDCHLTTLFFLHYPKGQPSFELVRTLGCPSEPFLKVNRTFLEDMLKQIFERSPTPHIHNIHNTAFANVVHRCASVPTPHRLLFYPFECDNFAYLVIATISPDCRDLYLDLPLAQGFSSLIALLHAQHTIDTYGPQLTLTELFAKEAGHDIAIQVQTILSKLNLVTTGRFTGDLAKSKVAEAENEVFATLRLAEFLGVAVDRNYQLREKRDFDIIDAIIHVVDQFQTEADERHISFRNDSKLNVAPFWGDRRAIEIAIGQVLFNAIKYSYGNSYISINVYNNGADRTQIDITNKSTISLPTDDPEVIFKFGWRSREAKELHVNGSGIGLFTVKKVLQAHLGDCTAKEEAGRVVTFSISLPSIKKIREELYELHY